MHLHTCSHVLRGGRIELRTAPARSPVAGKEGVGTRQHHICHQPLTDVMEALAVLLPGSSQEGTVRNEP